ncbi:MAG TPA: rhodanese-like domain-containing protein [Polyangia bacterium]|jgi:adenylyltransferase/sulfurtransferase|nr:rhodanese-like domain-containing protein [Polyangia bacterium]
MPRQIDVHQLQALRAAGETLYLLDVRQPWEHDLAALPGSVLVPLGELPQRADELDPPPGALIVAYCHHGVRSLNAAALLERMGYERVVSLAGGIDAWSLAVDPSVPRY